MNETSKISFSKAQNILKKFRYKPRVEWSDDERTMFKLCSFAVLSKKRLNNVLASIRSLSKLSDKSHYKYNELDIKLIKELILENLGICFERFKHSISLVKESDIEKISKHIRKIKEENLRLENEIQRLNFIIENFIREKDIQQMRDVQDLLNKKISEKKRNSAKKNKIKNEKLEFNDKSIKKFIEKWNQGYTTFEITEDFKKIGMNFSGSKKKRFKL